MSIILSLAGFGLLSFLLVVSYLVLTLFSIPFVPPIFFHLLLLSSIPLKERRFEAQCFEVVCRGLPVGLAVGHHWANIFRGPCLSSILLSFCSHLHLRSLKMQVPGSSFRLFSAQLGS
jgi:hypothetical protein